MSERVIRGAYLVSCRQERIRGRTVSLQNSSTFSALGSECWKERVVWPAAAVVLLLVTLTMLGVRLILMR